VLDTTKLMALQRREPMLGKTRVQWSDPLWDPDTASQPTRTAVLTRALQLCNCNRRRPVLPRLSLSQFSWTLKGGLLRASVTAAGLGLCPRDRLVQGSGLRHTGPKVPPERGTKDAE